ncbi:hypothetical protein FRC03_010930 [Tulasnella sp. 419]|nr:hypothetical protein FRC02_011017 [Tulasnella sp. 418]KAG8966975.1 hypothetical protein FRC03_010930 [Tulasnella sp. 419]
MKVIVTGASGVLGSAVYEKFRSDPQNDVIGLAHSRQHGDLIKVDLHDSAAVEKLVAEFKPHWVIHCAAERRPDVADKNPEATQRLNAEVPGFLAGLSRKYDYTLVYISTDYVFDGTSPPYEVTDKPNPLQFYGKSKLDGERAVLEGGGVDNVLRGSQVVLRVPVLYGPAPKNSDTAINILVDIVLDQSGKTYKMDHYATRYPTNTLDIASFLFRLAYYQSQANPNSGSTLSKSLPQILHYSAPEPFTKYEMCLVFAKILGVRHKHIMPDAEEPKGESAVTRPRDCKLSTKIVEDYLQMDVGACGFEEWWTSYLKKD